VDLPIGDKNVSSSSSSAPTASSVVKEDVPSLKQDTTQIYNVPTQVFGVEDASTQVYNVDEEDSGDLDAAAESSVVYSSPRVAVAATRCDTGVLPAAQAQRGKRNAE
jgi:hypothetical protein